MSRAATLFVWTLIVVVAGWSTTAMAGSDDALVQHQWSASFPPSTLQTYFDDETDRVFVAVTGEPAGEVDALGSVLTSRLQSLDEDWTVVYESDREVLEELDDDQVAQLGLEVEADRIVVARLADDGEWVPELTLGFYDEEAELLDSTMVRRGQAIRAYGEEDELEEPVAQEDVQPEEQQDPVVEDEPVAQADPEPDEPEQPDEPVAQPDPQPEPQQDEPVAEQQDEPERDDRIDDAELEREYDAQKLEWRDGHAYDSGQRLEGPDFYHAIGEPELADQYRSVRPGYLLGGVVLGVGGGVLMMASTETDSSLVTTAGLLGMVTGTILFFSGFAESHPMSRDEREQAVDDHNSDLRRELGLPGSTGPSARGRQFRPTTAIPSQDNAGGMLNTGGGAMIGITIPF